MKSDLDFRERSLPEDFGHCCVAGAKACRIVPLAVDDGQSGITRHEEIDRWVEPIQKTEVGLSPAVRGVLTGCSCTNLTEILEEWLM